MIVRLLITLGGILLLSAGITLMQSLLSVTIQAPNVASEVAFLLMQKLSGVVTVVLIHWALTKNNQTQ